MTDKENIVPSHIRKIRTKLLHDYISFYDLMDILLWIVDHHEEDCTDHCPDNVGICTRCTLIDIMKKGIWDEKYDIKVLLIKKDEVK